MFTLDSNSNRIQPIIKNSFHDLGFSERHHLQEWIANEPTALGEELLIIQKEFDGFDETRERLDLLALDKEGNLVIIENKLDDSGRNIVWQALKYVSYCSSLSKKQVIAIYQKYLQRHCADSSQSAEERICDFLEKPDLDEASINVGTNQRIMLVAAQFRKEVTSTALWLISKGISVQCMKVTPYSLKDEIIIDLVQVIPTPESKDLMIGLSIKDAEEQSAVRETSKREKWRYAYWELLLNKMQSSKCRLYENISPTHDHWLSSGSGVSGCPFNFIIVTKEIRVELWLSRANQEENKWLFDNLLKQKQEIEQGLDEVFEWCRLDEKKSSKICVVLESDTFNQDEWNHLAAWHVEKMDLFEKTLKLKLKDAYHQYKNQSSTQH